MDVNNSGKKLTEKFKRRIFEIENENEFQKLALEIYEYQAKKNPIYKAYISFLGKKPGAANTVTDIPFLPIDFFRSHKIITGENTGGIIFKSSGTSGMARSTHYVSDIALYEKSFLSGFNRFYNYPSQYCILALLPSYLEKEGSSLVYMVNKLIKESKHSQSGFYLDDPRALYSKIQKLKEGKTRVFLIGVTFALLDLAEKYSPDMSGCTVIETGGMKGRRKELTRQEVHNALKKEFNLELIHSEYGMTELLSQAYSPGGGIFICPAWMRVMIRDTLDPLSILGETGKTGGINIIDLANLNSCSFIATGDLGKMHIDGKFEVLGRFDNSDIRGCNLLVE